MKKIILTLLITLSSTSAIASINNNISKPNTKSNSNVLSSGNSSNHLNNHQYQDQHMNSRNINRGNNSTSNNSATNAGNNSSVNIAGDNYIERRRPVNTAYSTPLTSGIDTCLGSVSAGGQAATFGLSLGKTTIDKNCVRLKNATWLYSTGYKHAAIHLMCQDKDILKAMGDAGEIECSNMRSNNTYALSVKRTCQYPNQVNCNK